VSGKVRSAETAGQAMKATSRWRGLQGDRATPLSLPLRLIHAEHAESREVEEARALVTLRALPPREQAALELIYWDYLSSVSAAMVLGSTKGAFEGLLRRGTHRLLARIREATSTSSTLQTDQSWVRSSARLAGVASWTRRGWSDRRRGALRPVSPDDERVIRATMEDARRAAGRRPATYDPRRFRMSDAARDQSSNNDASG
jgi:hypothetical protein